MTPDANEMLAADLSKQNHIEFVIEVDNNGFIEKQKYQKT